MRLHFFIIFAIGALAMTLSCCTNDTTEVKGKNVSKDSIIHCRQYGKELRNSSRFLEALDIHRRGLAIAKEAKDTLEIVQALNNIGTDYRRLGILNEASSVYYQAMELTSKYSDRNDTVSMKNEVVSLNGIGNILLIMNRLDAADSIFRRALKGERMLDSEVGMAINYANLGSIFQMKNKNDSALHYYNLSMELNKKAKSTLGISLCHTHIGNLYEKTGKLEKAAEEYEKAYKLMKDEGDRWHALESCLSLAQMYVNNKTPQRAMPFINEAEMTAKAIKSLEHEGRVYELKYKVYEINGRHKDALKYYKLSNSYADSVSNEKNSNHINNLMVQYERQMKEYEVGKLENELNKEKLDFAYIFIAGILLLTILLAVLVATLNKARQQQKKAKDDITKAYEETKRALDVKTSFIKSMKHEIRTPLNGIIGFSQLLSAKTQNDDNLKTMTDVIIQQGQQLASIIDVILETADIDTLSPQYEDVNIDEMVNDALDNIKHKLSPEVNTSYLAREAGFTIRTDRTILLRALGLVLDNATKFTKKGTIRVVTKYDYGIMVLAVTDTGCGIPKDKQEWVFEHFTKIDQFVPGTGMGLALCRALITRLGGLVYIDQGYTNGCRVVMRLPIQHSK